MCYGSAVNSSGSRARGLRGVVGACVVWLLPAKAHAQDAGDAPVLAVASPDDLARATRLGLGTPRAAHTLLFGVPPTRWVAEAGGAPTRLLWPVRGGARGPGYRAEHGRHRAVDIGARCGAPIRAAHAGLVAYSGDRVGTMGNVLVLVGADGWVTAYGHTRRTLVAAGRRVERGEIIGEVGDTGDARGCHVHLVALHRGVRLDPERFFDGAPPRRRHR